MREPFYTRLVLCDREQDRRSSPKTRQEPGGPGDHALLCVACGHRITDEDYRTEMSGAHSHTFVNPAGFQYVIGCFTAAPGCIHLGNTESHFSWFPGWSWQLAACGQCRAHLGWIYRNAGEQFHGLIADRLRSE